MRVTVGNRVFSSKKAATERIREVLYKYPIGATLNDEDTEFVVELLRMHSEAEQKFGCGVASIQVESNGPTRGFWLTRIDGSRTDFSFIACLTPKTAESNAMAAMRSAVRDQIADFRKTRETGSAVCDATGEPIVGNGHVDHIVPFHELVAEFLGSEGISLKQVCVMPTTDGETETVLADDGLRDRWSRFHRERAKLRLVTARYNLSRSKL